MTEPTEGTHWRGRIVLDIYTDKVVGNLLPHGGCPEKVVRKEESCCGYETDGASESLVCDLLAKLSCIEAEEKGAGREMTP